MPDRPPKSERAERGQRGDRPEPRLTASLRERLAAGDDELPAPLTAAERALLVRNLQGVPRWLELSASWSWRLLIVGGAIIAASWALAQLFLVTMPIILATVIATILIPPAEYLERRGMPPAAAGLVVVLGSILVVVGTLAAVAPSFVDQLRELGPTLIEGRDTVIDWASGDPLNIDPARIDELLQQAREALGSNSQGVVGGIARGASIVGQGIAALVLMIVLLFFFVKDRDQITGWAKARLPEESRETASALGQRAWAALGGYVRGTAIIALIDAIGIGIGLAIIGVPLAMPLTLLVFMGGFLPVIGAFAAGLIAVLVALAAGGLSKALLALGLILAVQQLEGNILQPMIMRRAVNLHPTVILIALTAGAAIAGIVGAFLSVPIAAVAAAVGNELRLRGESNGNGSAGAEATAPA